MIANGIYRHYKGGIYEVIASAIHSETMESMVVCRDVRDAEKVWVRPQAAWNEAVMDNGVEQPRFQRIASDLDDMDSRRMFKLIEEIIEIGEMYDRFSDDNIVAYYDRETDEVIRLTTRVLSCLDGDVSEGVLDESERSAFCKAEHIYGNRERYQLLPKDGLLSEYELMEDFASDLPGLYGEKLLDAIQGKGAFRRFKDTANRLGVLDHWYAYKDMRYRREAREWCEATGIDWTKSYMNRKIQTKGDDVD